MKVIHLLSLGSADRRLIQSLSSPLRETFGFRVEAREWDVDISMFFDSQRVQYSSTQILQHLAQLRGDTHLSIQATDGDKILAVVAEDLYVPVLTYVFGEAELNGDLAVVSYHRLQSELYGLPRDPELLRVRLLKEAVHELGHTFGLEHCRDRRCVMTFSNSLADTDYKGHEFCPRCRKRLMRVGNGTR